MNKMMVYGVAQFLCKQAINLAGVYAIYQVSKPAAIAIGCFAAVGMLCAELQFRASRKEQERVASEFMQLIGKQRGQENC